MDEIVIGDKKYISSKQAAKATGYAKDYVGQLCREGRVPARLVGRSWYVLESAIQDHRFGESGGESVVPKEASRPSESDVRATWESPRYEASTVEPVSAVNILRSQEAENIVENSSKDGEPGTAEQLQDTWQAWFDRFEHTTERGDETEKPEQKQEPEPVQEPEPEPVHEEKDIQTTYEYEQQLPPDELLPRHTMRVTAYNTQNDEVQERAGHKKLIMAVQMSGILLAAVVSIIAALGSGYFDSYIISNRQVGIIAGVALYDK